MDVVKVIVQLYMISVGIAVVVAALLPLCKKEESATGAYSLLREMNWTTSHRPILWPYTLYCWYRKRT